METPRLAGVYGGQLYNLHSRFLDKRDLDIFSSLTPRIERSDSDFWNANSMFPRTIWERQRFDESVYELEDHYWTKQLLPLGFKVHFEPQALVYHYSHEQRLDREFLPRSTLSPEERIDQAVAELREPSANWARIMTAGLTLSSLTRTPGIERATHALGRQFTSHWDFDVRWRMAQALGKIRSCDAVRYLVTGLTDRSFYPRDEAAWALARLGELAVDKVAATAESLPPDCRPFAALALGLSGVEEGEQQGVGILAGDTGGALAAGDQIERRDAAYFAGELAGVPAANRLVPLLAPLLEGDTELARVGCWALGCFAGHSGVDWRRIRRHAEEHPDLLVRFEAVVALGKRARSEGAISGEAADDLLRPLQAAYGDQEGRVRYAALQSIRLMAEDGLAVPFPSRLADDPDFGVRYELDLLTAARAASTGPATPSRSCKAAGVLT